MRDRHCATYAAALRQWGADLKGSRQQVALAEVEADLENARAAWRWAIERGSVERLDQAIEGLGLFYEWQLRYAEGEAAFREAAGGLAATAQQVPDRGLRVLAKALAWQGRFVCLRRRYSPARPLLERGLALLDDPRLADQDTRAEKALVLWAMGWLETAGDVAKGLLERSLALYRALDDRWWTAQALFALGFQARCAGDYDRAIQHYEESADVYRALGDQRGIADATQFLGYIYALRGQAGKAERLGRERLALAHAGGHPLATGTEMMVLGATLVYLGQYAEAHSLLEEGKAIVSELGLGVEVASYVAFVGVAKVHLGRYDGARAYGPEAYAWEFDLRAFYLPFAVLGCVALAGGAYAEAERWLRKGVAAYRKSGIRGGHSHLLSTYALAARGLGDLCQAQRHMVEALRTAIKMQDVYALVFALPAMALLLADRGEVERAVELYALASCYPVVANSRWFGDVAGVYIAAVAATLLPDVVAAAQERGRARDLWATAKELYRELGET